MKIGSKVIDTSSEKYGSEISIDSGTKGLLLSPTIFKELSSKLESLKTTNVFQENSPAFYICNDNYLDDYPNITLRVGNTDIVLNVFTYLDFAGASTVSSKIIFYSVFLEKTKLRRRQSLLPTCSP